MQIRYSFKQLDSSDAVKEYSSEKSLKLKKYFDGRIDVDWIFSSEKSGYYAEAKVHGDTFSFVAEGDGGDLYTAIDSVVDRLDTQIRKHKEKLKEHNK